MFSIFKQRTLAIYHYLTTRRPHLGAFIFISILFLTGYVLAGIYAANTGNLSVLNPQFVMAATDTAPAAAAEQATAAAPSSATDGVGILMGWVIKLLLAGASLMLRLAIFCLAFIIQIAGYNGYLTSTAVNVGWVMVRDITNMFFVVILLLVAFGTILGLEQYEWKKMLVKFFFAAVLVNFSRVICGAIIDVGQVVMITFVNGIAATAGGNLINAFSLDTVMSLSQNASATTITDTNELFTAALGSVVFSAMVLAMMMVFVFMLVSRLVVLWILIVLSPFAFVLSVIPQTQKYASQWWSEFGNHVVVGPAVVFFLWLSFAVVGGGDINTEIAGSSAVPETAKISGQDAAGIGGIMDWNKMSNFAIAIGILLVGAKTSQSLGTVGGSAMSKATDFGKKVAMVASGAGAAMWAGGKVKQGAVATGKWAAMNVPVVGGKAWKRHGETIAAKATDKWQQANQWRDKQAKKMDSGSKKLRDLERQKDLGQIDEAKFQQKKQELVAKGEITGGALGVIGRGFKGAGSRLVESSVRADKRVENWKKIAESRKKVTEAETSLSSEASGQLKTKMDVEVELQEVKQKEKGATKRAEVAGSVYKGDIAAYTSALEAAGPAPEIIRKATEEYSAAAKEYGTSGKEEDKKKMDAAKATIEETQKQYAPQLAALKDARGRTTLVGATAKVQAETATSIQKGEEGKLRTEMLESAEGKKMFKEKAAAHEIEEGVKDLESLGLTRAKSHEIDHDGKDWAKKMADVTKNLGDLRTEKSALDKKPAGTLTADEQLKKSNIDQRIYEEEKRVRSAIDKMARNSVHTNPSVFAAQSRAKYDHEYDIYRGKHKTAVDQAAQESIWKPYGITAPTTAGHETIVDGIHAKVFKNMDYTQTMQSVDGFTKAMQQKKANDKEPTFNDKAISQALFYQLQHGSWVDDAGQKTAEQKVAMKKQIADAKVAVVKMMKDLGVSGDEIKVTTKRANTKTAGSSGQTKINPHQASVIGDFLSAGALKGLITPEFVGKLRGGTNESDVQAFKAANKKAIEDAINSNSELKRNGVTDMDTLFDMLKADRAEVDKIVAKLS